MAPKRATPAQPSRRSDRIASRASSRASSRAPSESAENTVEGRRALSPIVEQSPAPRVPPTMAKKKEAPVFNAAIAIAKIMGGAVAFIKTLTRGQKDAVILGFRDKTNDLEDRLRVLEQQNDELAVERDQFKQQAAQRITIRDHFYAERMSITKERLEREAREKEERERSEKAVTENALQTPDNKQQKPSQAETAPAKLLIKSAGEANQIEQGESSPSAPAFASTIEQPLHTSTPRPQKSIFTRFFTTISSPFSSFRASTPAPSPEKSHEEVPQEQTPQVPQEPLGELPSNRKRPAEEPAPSEPSLNTVTSTPTTFTPNTSKTPRHFTNIPSARNPIMPSSLNTISERSENSELTDASIVAPDPTPSRAPRSVTKMRREARERARKAQTPVRSWSQKPAPREPNADTRLEKLRHFQELNSQVEAMKTDEDIKDMIQRPVKRVKIDQLVSIPHNRPGESSSTFRMYDVDSDDEMEVDADEPLRVNIFERQTPQSAEKQQTPPPAEPKKPVIHELLIPQPKAVEHAQPEAVQQAATPMPAAPPQQQPLRKEPEPYVPKETWPWPTVTDRTKPYKTFMYRDPKEIEVSHAKFVYGYKYWQLHGEIPKNLF